VVIYGKARGERARRRDSIPIADLEKAAAMLEEWLDRESSISGATPLLRPPKRTSSRRS
jgi:hypothetical protein